MAYAALLAYQPIFPLEISSLSTINEASFQRNLKESRFWLFKEIAGEIKDGIVALTFWEQFFIMYFEVTNSSPSIGIASILTGN